MEVRVKQQGSPAQAKFWHDPAKFRLFTGGIGSGKTTAGCVEVLRQPEGSLGMIVAPTYPQLRDSTLETFKRLYGKTIATHNVTRGEMKLINGTSIIWRSADDPDSLRGPNLGWWWLDEGAMCPELVFDILIGRLRLPPGRGWITTTPRGLSWLHKLFVVEQRQNYSTIISPTAENPFLDTEYVQSLEEKYSGSWALQELKGEFVEWVDTPCYTSFSRQLNVEPGLRELYNPRLPLMLTCDFNARYMCWPVVQVVGGKPIVINEIVSRKPALIEDMVRKFRNEYPSHPGELWLYGDASGNAHSVQNERSNYDLIRLALKGYTSAVVTYVPAANPGIRDRINAVNRSLKGAGGAPGLRIDSGCSELILDLMQTEWDKSGTKEKQYADPNDSRCERTHATSALGYLVHREWPVAIEVYKSLDNKPRKQPKYGRLPGSL